MILLLYKERCKYRIVHSIECHLIHLILIDDINVPKGSWRIADCLEPIAKDFKNFGPGGVTQAVTYSEINTIKAYSN